MNLTITSWNGDARINDGTNFTSIIIPGALADLTRQAVYVDRAENFPYLSGAVLPAHSFTFKVIVPSGATIHTQRELLKQIFNITDFTPHALIATDELARQWRLVGFPVRIVADNKVMVDTSFFVTLAVAEPVWQGVTPHTNTWNVTATGQTFAINAVPGNLPSRPKITFTPTGARLTTWLYSRWIPVYNRVPRALSNYPIDVTNGGINTATLVNGSGISNQINQIGGILAGDTTIPINVPVGGGLPVFGMGYVDTEQISWTGNTGGTQLTGVTRGIGGTTPAAHANGAVITFSKVMVNGDDMRVVVDGAFVNQWINGPNSASTKLWTNQNWQVGHTALLRGTLPNNGTPATVAFWYDANSINTLYALKAARNNVFMIGTEAFTYSPANVDLVNRQITNVQRAQKYTAFAAHSQFDAIIWIEHDIWLIYGNAFAPSPVVDSTQQPLLNLGTSTNTSWAFANFFDNTSARPGAWSGAVLLTSGKQTAVYTGNQEANANPSTELGLSLRDFQVANVWKSETATLQWLFYHPVGITTVSMSGSKYVLSNGTWPAWSGLQKSNDWITWTFVWNEAKPTLSNTWQAFSHAGVALAGTFLMLRLIMYGTIAALANNVADIQGDTVTLTLDNTLTPVVSLGAEQTSTYYLSCTLTNVTTGDYFSLAINMPLNASVIVDCNYKTVNLSDGSNVISALTPSTIRNDWITILNGNQTFQFDDPGTTGVTVQFVWQDRTI